MRPPAFPLFALCLLGLGGATPLAAQATDGPVTLAGVVRESGGAVIPFAIVRVEGGASTTTDEQGRFVLPRTPAGAHVILVQAYGYRTRILDVLLRADTAITIELDASALALDSLRADARSITFRGTMRSASDGLPVMDAQVTLYPRGRTTGAISGTYRLLAPADELVTLVFEGVAHLPVRMHLSATQDTVVDVMMEVDSVAVRMMAHQVQRLTDRSTTVPSRLQYADREDVIRSGSGTVGELVRRYLPRNVIPESPREWSRIGYDICIVVDDRSVIPLTELMVMQPDVIERVEMYGRSHGERGKEGETFNRTFSEGRMGSVGSHMIRVYTRRYVAQMAGRPLPRIFFPTLCK